MAFRAITCTLNVQLLAVILLSRRYSQDNDEPAAAIEIFDRNPELAGAV